MQSLLDKLEISLEKFLEFEIRHGKVLKFCKNIYPWGPSNGKIDTLTGWNKKWFGCEHVKLIAEFHYLYLSHNCNGEQMILKKEKWKDIFCYSFLSI